MNELAICSGIGGLTLGLRGAIPGLRAVCHIEREAYAASILATQMEKGALDQAPIWSDVETFNGTAWRGLVDIISAGIPCQPFSVAGKHRGLSDDRWLWPLVEAIIRDVEPGLVFLENVPGLMRHGLGFILGGLADLGFDAEWGVFSAAASGAPHIRKRFFLLAHAHGKRLEEWEVQSGNPRPEQSAVVGSGWWSTEPDVGRVAASVPHRVDRLRALGNAVVPAVAERAFRVLYARITEENDFIAERPRVGGDPSLDSNLVLRKRIYELTAEVASKDATIEMLTKERDRLVADGLEALSEEDMRRMFGDKDFDAEVKIVEFVARHAIDRATIERLRGLLLEVERRTRADGDMADAAVHELVATEMKEENDE